MIISCDCATQTQIQIQHFFAFLQKKFTQRIEWDKNIKY